MDSHHVIDAAKTAPAWVAIGVSHISSDLTLSGVASIVAIVYSVIQTYISVKRYRAGK
jgi:hypothetical protein